ncbi:hypothetical protein [Allofustis seminis]|nr:hypothetical protein [Allofustis seminis]
MESGKKKSRAALLTMVERKKRHSLLFKIPAMTQANIQAILDDLERNGH